MIPPLEELIALALDATKTQTQSREMALVKTKLDEARLWLEDARRTEKANSYFPGRSD